MLARLVGVLLLVIVVPVYAGDTFATLTAQEDGVVMWCRDCTKATPCAGSGTGAYAKRMNGAWDCD